MLTVFLPAYNEEANVKRIERELLPVIKKLRYKTEVLVVDDGSTDGTVQVVSRLLKKHKNIRLVRHPKNMGLGCAVRTGIRHARGELFVALDSDFTFHPRYIPRLIERFERGDVDCVAGYYDTAKDVEFHRKLLSRGVNFLYSILLTNKVRSFSPIFKLYKTRQLRELGLHSKDYNINAEIIFGLIKKKRRIAEVPVGLTKRRYGVSKLDNMREMKNHLVLLSKIFLWRVFR